MNIKYTNVFEVFKKNEIKCSHNIVRKLVNKAGTEEGITVEIMKLVVQVAGDKICYILNRSLEKGIFSNE